MSDVHIHLLLNHVPIFALILGLLLIVANVVFKSKALTMLSLVLFVGAALFTLPVYFTGEGAEEAVENLPLVTESLIEAHEHAAKTAIILVELTGLLALIGGILAVRTKHIPAFGVVAIIISALVSTLSIVNTGMLGGQIRHSEIRHTASGTVLPSQNPEQHEADED